MGTFCFADGEGKDSLLHPYSRFLAKTLYLLSLILSFSSSVNLPTHSPKQNSKQATCSDGAGGGERKDIVSCQNVILAIDESVPLELKGELCRDEKISRDRQSWPEVGFVSNLSPDLLKDTKITMGLTTAE